MEASKCTTANTKDHDKVESQSTSRRSAPMVTIPTDTATVTDVNLNDKPNVFPPDTLDTRLLSSSSTVTRISRYRGNDVRPEVELFTVQFVADVIDHVVGICDNHVIPADDDDQDQPDVGSDYFRYRETLLRVVTDISERHRVEFSEMTARLLADVEKQLVKREDYPVLIQTMFDGVVREMLADGECNWGRVATVYAFTSSFGQRWTDYKSTACGSIIVHGRHGDGVKQPTTWLIDELKIALSRVIVNRLTTWIRANGGWKEFHRFFTTRIPPSSSSPQVRFWPPSLGLIATAAGIGALAVIVSSLAHHH